MSASITGDNVDHALVVCAHVPYKDPRVVWHIQELSKHFCVDVLYLQTGANKLVGVLCRDPISLECFCVEGGLPSFSGVDIGPLQCSEPSLKVSSAHNKDADTKSSTGTARWLKGLKRAIRSAVYNEPASYVDSKEGTALPVCAKRIIGWSYIIVYSFVYRLPLVYFKLIKLYNITRHHYKLVVSNDIECIAVGSAIARNNNGILIYDSHENWSHVRPNTPKIYSYLTSSFERLFARNAKIVTSVSPLLVQHLRATLRHDDVRLLPNAARRLSGGEVEYLEARAEKYKEVYNRIAEGRIIFLFQGGVAPERGLIEIIDCWRYVLPKAVLIIRAPDGENPELDRALAAARGGGMLGRTIHRLPSIGEGDLIASAMAAHIGVIPYNPSFPNHTMCCPNKLSQYMQASTPILTNEIPYVTQIVQHANCGWVYKYKSTAVEKAEIINNILLDGDNIDIFGKNGRNYANKYYYWEKFYNSIISDAVKYNT